MNGLRVRRRTVIGRLTGMDAGHRVTILRPGKHRAREIVLGHIRPGPASEFRFVADVSAAGTGDGQYVCTELLLRLDTRCIVHPADRQVAA